MSLVSDIEDAVAREIAKTIIQVSMAHAYGYRSSVSRSDDDATRAKAEACATAVNNTAWFTLSAMGFNAAQIHDLYDEARSGESDKPKE